MIPVAIILFVVLLRNFYTGDPSKGMFCSYSANSRFLMFNSSLLVVSILIVYTHVVKQLLGVS